MKWDENTQSYVLYNNYATLEQQCYDVYGPATFRVRWAASPTVISEGSIEVDNMLQDAGEIMRKQMTDDPSQERTIYFRYNDNRDRSVHVNFIGERVDFDVLPIEIDECIAGGIYSSEYWRLWMQENGVNILFVNRYRDCLDFQLECSGADCGSLYGLTRCSSSFMFLSLESQDLSNTFVHELGHEVGLFCDQTHSQVPYDVMVQGGTGIAKGDDISSEQISAYRFNIPYDEEGE